MALAFTVEPVRDKSSTVYCTIDAPDGQSCGTFHYDGPDAQAANETVDVGRDGPVTIFLKQCNTVDVCASPASNSATAWAPLDAPSIQNARASGPNVDFEVHWNPHGGAVQLHVTVQTQDGTGVYDHTFDESDVADSDHSQAFTDDVDATVGTPISIDPGQFGKQVQITATLSDASSLNRHSTTAQDTSVHINPPIVAKLGKAPCTGSSPPPNCGHVTLTLTNFQHDGTVYCHFDVSGGSGIPDADVPTDNNGNGAKIYDAQYTDNGAQITVTCESITDHLTW